MVLEVCPSAASWGELLGNDADVSTTLRIKRTEKLVRRSSLATLPLSSPRVTRLAFF